MASEAGSHKLTAESMDVVLKQMVACFEDVDSFQGSTVKLPKAELDLLRQLELSRDLMLEALQKPHADRAMLLEIFGGDCARLARVRAVCESVEFSEMNAGDQRLKTCLSACESVEKVILDLGFCESLKKAQERERAALEGEDDDTSDKCLEHLARCSLAEADAVAMDREGKVPEALEKYEECQHALALAIAELPKDSNDLPDIVVHHREVAERIQYLHDLKEGDNVQPVENHINAAEIDLKGKRRKKKRYMAACGAVGAGAGLLMLGPWVAVGAVGASATVAVGAAMAGGAAGAHAATRDDKIGQVARGAAHKTGKGLDGAATTVGLGDAVERARVKTAKTAAEIDEKYGVSDKLETAKEAASRKASDLDEKYGVTEKLDGAKAAAASALSSMKAGYPFKKKAEKTSENGSESW